MEGTSMVEPRNKNLEATLPYLRASTDEEKFVGLLLVSKCLPSAAAESASPLHRQLYVVYRAVGAAFLLRMLRTRDAKREAEGSNDGAGGDRSGARGPHPFPRLALSVLSVLVRSNEVLRALPSAGFVQAVCTVLADLCARSPESIPPAGGNTATTSSANSQGASAKESKAAAKKAAADEAKRAAGAAAARGMLEDAVDILEAVVAGGAQPRIGPGSEAPHLIAACLLRSVLPSPIVPTPGEHRPTSPQQEHKGEQVAAPSRLDAGGKLGSARLLALFATAAEQCPPLPLIPLACAWFSRKGMPAASHLQCLQVLALLLSRVCATPGARAKALAGGGGGAFLGDLRAHLGALVQERYAVQAVSLRRHALQVSGLLMDVYGTGWARGAVRGSGGGPSFALLLLSIASVELHVELEEELGYLIEGRYKQGGGGGGAGAGAREKEDARRRSIVCSLRVVQHAIMAFTEDEESAQSWASLGFEVLLQLKGRLDDAIKAILAFAHQMGQVYLEGNAAGIPVSAASMPVLICCARIVGVWLSEDSESLRGEVASALPFLLQIDCLFPRTEAAEIGAGSSPAVTETAEISAGSSPAGAALAHLSRGLERVLLDSAAEPGGEAEEEPLRAVAVLREMRLAGVGARCAKGAAACYGSGERKQELAPAQEDKRHYDATGYLQLLVAANHAALAQRVVKCNLGWPEVRLLLRAAKSALPAATAAEPRGWMKVLSALALIQAAASSAQLLPDTPKPKGAGNDDAAPICPWGDFWSGALNLLLRGPTRMYASALPSAWADTLREVVALCCSTRHVSTAAAIQRHARATRGHIVALGLEIGRMGKECSGGVVVIEGGTETMRAAHRLFVAKVLG